MFEFRAVPDDLILIFFSSLDIFGGTLVNFEDLVKYNNGTRE